MDLEQVVAGLIEKVERRYYGKYRGLVVDNADPELLGRLKLRVPSVLGANVVTGWALPCLPYGGDANQGWLSIPEVGAGVWVEFEEGDLEFPVWVGTFWSKPGGDSEMPKPNTADGSEESAVQDPPTRKIIKTLRGHTIQFEDKSDDDALVLIVEGVHGHVIVLDKGGIKITDGVNQHEVTLDGSGITIADGKNSDNKIVMDSSGVLVQDKNGNKITMSATGGFPAGPGIDLNSGARLCLDGLIDWLLSHKHIGNMGAPTPLSPDNMTQLIQAKASPGSGILSDSVKAK